MNFDLHKSTNKRSKLWAFDSDRRLIADHLSCSVWILSSRYIPLCQRNVVCVTHPLIRTIYFWFYFLFSVYLLHKCDLFVVVWGNLWLIRWSLFPFDIRWLTHVYLVRHITHITSQCLCDIKVTPKIVIIIIITHARFSKIMNIVVVRLLMPSMHTIPYVNPFTICFLKWFKWCDLHFDQNIITRKYSAASMPATGLSARHIFSTNVFSIQRKNENEDEAKKTRRRWYATNEFSHRTMELLLITFSHQSDTGQQQPEQQQQL